ncbi:YceI family protein [Janibacter melonis]|uniref:YceI family protein n=1 Tax=Janibacter melonis TaxID=262209 RepID=UPI002094F51F|nr:YceI family protein [Janibacter melonis]
MSLAGAPGADAAHAGRHGTWDVDPEESSARFHVRDKLFLTVHGSMPVRDGGAEVTADADVRRAWVALDAARVETGSTHRDSDLAKPRFLDTAATPVVEVVVEDARATSGAVVPATLSARGREAALDLRLESITAQTPPTAQTSPTTDPGAGDVVRVRVTARLDRTPLGIGAPSFVIGRYLDLEADLLLRRRSTGDS